MFSRSGLDDGQFNAYFFTNIELQIEYEMVMYYKNIHGPKSM